MASQRIKFVDKIDVQQEIDSNFDSDYYMYQFGADQVVAQCSDRFVEVEMTFEVWFDDDETTEEEMWYNICGECNRPQRIDGGEEF